MTIVAMNCTGVTAPSNLSYFTAIISAFLTFITVPGNLLVLVTVYKDPNKDLRTPFCLYVVNLAIADLIVGCVVEPISVTFHLYEGIHAGATLENVALIHMSYFISCTASVLSLAALTVDRFVAVEWPVKYRTKLSLLHAGIVSLFIWLVSLSFPFIYFRVGYMMYAFLFANTSIVFTLLILIFAYLRIISKVRAQTKISASLQAGISATQIRLKTVTSLREGRITNVFIAVIAAYGCCYAPTCVLIYLMNFCTSCSCYSIHWFRDMQFIFVLINSSLNPFLYSWRLPSFKNAFNVILRRHSYIRRASSTPSTSNVFEQIWEFRLKLDSLYANEPTIYTLSQPTQQNPRSQNRSQTLSLPWKAENPLFIRVESFRGISENGTTSSAVNVLDKIDVDEIPVSLSKAQTNTNDLNQENNSANENEQSKSTKKH